MIQDFWEAIDAIQTEKYNCGQLYLDISRWSVVRHHVSPF